MSAKLSRTLADMAILEFPFLLFVVRPFLSQGLIAWLALDNASPLLDESGGHRLEKNAVRRCLNHGLGSLLNMQLLAQPRGNDDLAFGGKPYGIGLNCRTHKRKSDPITNIRQFNNYMT